MPNNSLIRSPYFILFAPIVTLVFLTISSCTSIAINETAYDYSLAEDKLNALPKTLILAPRNIGIPSKNYLQRYEQKIDDAVIERLTQNGYRVIQSDVFEAAWRQAERKFGSPYNSSLSQINANAFKRTMHYVFDELQKSHDAEAILFTDLLEQLIVFSGSNNRRAKWHGVSRAPKIRGGNQLPASFDWSQTIPAVSLRVIIYSLDGNLLFKSFGGLEVSRQLNADKARFVRRDKLFTSNKNVTEGVAIALHPFIPLQP